MTAHVTRAVVEGSDAGKQEQILVKGDGSSGNVAVDGSMQGGCADSGREETVTIEMIVSNMPRVKIAQLTKEDP